jgi:hypothetical protein
LSPGATPPDGGEHSMAEIVNCEICGGMYNERYLNAHKRLSHGRKSKAKTVVSPSSESKNLKAIFSMYERLSEDEKKKFLERLTS